MSVAWRMSMGERFSVPGTSLCMNWTASRSTERASHFHRPERTVTVVFPLSDLAQFLQYTHSIPGDHAVFGVMFSLHLSHLKNCFTIDLPRRRCQYNYSDRNGSSSTSALSRHAGGLYLCTFAPAIPSTTRREAESIEPHHQLPCRASPKGAHTRRPLSIGGHRCNSRCFIYR